MGYIIAFISGAIVGVILMCVLQISSKNVQEDEEQEKKTILKKKTHINILN